MNLHLQGFKLYRIMLLTLFLAGYYPFLHHLISGLRRFLPCFYPYSGVCPPHSKNGQRTNVSIARLMQFYIKNKTVSKNQFFTKKN